MFLPRDSVNELLKMKEDLTRERDEQLAEIVKLREALNNAQENQNNLESNNADAQTKMQELQQDIQIKVGLLSAMYVKSDVQQQCMALQVI